MILYSKIFGCCLLLALLSFGCSKDGEPGPQGEKGEQGEKGDPGTANVVYSDWLESEFSNDRFYEEYTLEEIDTNQYSLSSTMFLLYGKTVNGVVYQLPRLLSSTTYNYYIVPDFGTGLPARIFLYREGTPPGENSIPTHFRYMIIPGGISTSGRKGQIDFDDYKQVRKFYNIPN